ncbi:MAG: diguanylate cyclase, partial [Chloroflexota bacterium]|nr:diguanylate cyclase [Chloroflexota bacterium]
ANVIKRLQDTVRQAGWTAPGKPSSQFAISVSAGTATFPADGSDIDSLIRTADKALYAAKTGRLQRKRAGSRSLAASA